MLSARSETELECKANNIPHTCCSYKQYKCSVVLYKCITLLGEIKACFEIKSYSVL